MNYKESHSKFALKADRSYVCTRRALARWSVGRSAVTARSREKESDETI